MKHMKAAKQVNLDKAVTICTAMLTNPVWRYYYNFMYHFKYCTFTSTLHYSSCANFYVFNTKFSLNMGYFYGFLNSLSQATDTWV